MASSPSSVPATTFPTASTKKMRVRSKSTSAVEDVKEVPPKNEKRVVVEAVHTSLKNGVNGAQNGEESFVKATKDKHHDRKSRSGRRGLPKKGGAGGKGTWGAIGEVLNEEDLKIRDQHDPNYESEEDEDEPFAIEECKPELTEEEFSTNITPIVQEYFEHGETEDVVLSLAELNISSRKYKKTFVFSRHRPYDGGFFNSFYLFSQATQREMASILISDLYGRHLTQHDIAQGINSKALNEADLLLRMKHGMVRLDSVWGVAGGRRPVKHLVKKMILLLKEYLNSEDIEEVSHLKMCILPFLNPISSQAIVMMLEDGHERVMTLMKNLLQFFSNTNIVKPDQIKSGFQRVFDSFADIQLDIPHAHTLLEKFTDMCARDGIIPISLTLKVPSRGRKRFVSEGDGGIVKS
ncbi:programmed cell death protein 4-like [Orbicella faveolata]|uniref:programmed cell death protein 4-like n=1 Tax=Orbicella faveolata TaxID=48498 RepID=UPI0009E303E8|nr:programmed cell death protein 4-like [Orbicella faveolata]